MIANDWGQYGAAPYVEYSISTTACDWSGATDVPYLTSQGNAKLGSKFHYFNNTGIFSVRYRVGANLMPGQTYYFNIRAVDCAFGSCNLLGNLQSP